MRGLLSILFILTLFSCKNNCTCTKRACPSCKEVFFTLTANEGNNAPAQFANGDLGELYIIQTTKTFQVLDSSKVFFNIETKDSTYNRRAFIEAADFDDLNDFRNYNFLLKNKVLNTIDTLSSVAYNQEATSRLCNTCSGSCPDEYIDCLKFSNYSLMFNDSLVNTFEIQLFK